MSFTLMRRERGGIGSRFVSLGTLFSAAVFGASLTEFRNLTLTDDQLKKTDQKLAAVTRNENSDPDTKLDIQIFQSNLAIFKVEKARHAQNSFILAFVAATLLSTRFLIPKREVLVSQS